MKNYSYPTFSEFIAQNDLKTNQIISIIESNNLQVCGLLFRDLYSNLLFVNISEESDGYAVDSNKITYLKLENGNVWAKTKLN